MARVDRLSKKGKALFRRLSTNHENKYFEHLKGDVNFYSQKKELTPYDKQQIGKLLLQKAKNYVRQAPMPNDMGRLSPGDEREMEGGRYLANEKDRELILDIGKKLGVESEARNVLFKIYGKGGSAKALSYIKEEYNHGDKLRAKQLVTSWENNYDHRVGKIGMKDLEEEGQKVVNGYRAVGMEARARAFEKKMKGSRLDLTSRVSAAIATIGSISGLFFLSSNVTGNVIGSLNQSSSNFIGIGLFLVGLVGAFMYFRKK